MDRGAWQATVQGVAQSRTRLSDFHSLILNKLRGNISGTENSTLPNTDFCHTNSLGFENTKRNNNLILLLKLGKQRNKQNFIQCIIMMFQGTMRAQKDINHQDFEGEQIWMVFWSTGLLQGRYERVWWEKNVRDYIHSIPGKQNNCEELTEEKMQSLITVDMLSGPTELRYSIGPEANEINRVQTVKGFNSYNEDWTSFPKGYGKSWRNYKKWTTKKPIWISGWFLWQPISGVWLKVSKGGKDKLNTV